MKKFFLIPLMTLVCSVMAWGSEIVVNDFATLKTQLSASGTYDVVKLGQDISYDGTDVLNIARSLTLDGQGYKITGTGNCNSRIDNVEIKNQPTSIAIDAERNKTNLVVIIKNLDLDKPTSDGRYYGIMALDGAKELTLENVHINNTPGGNAQGFCAQGANTELMKVTIRNSTISGGAGYGYATYILRPLDLKIYNSTIEGYCTLYFKGPQGLLHNMNPAPHYGSGNAGARGTEVYAENTYFNATNKGNGGSNDFGNIVFEDDGISLELVNCGMDAQALGNAVQDVFLLNGFYFPIEERAHQAITVSISGDNSHINGNIVCNQWYGKYKYVNSKKNSWIAENGVSMKDQNFDKIGSYDANGSWNYGDKDIDITITGGTYAVNPKEYKFNTHINTSDASYVDPSTLSSGASYPIHTDARVPKYTKGLIIDTDIYEVKTLSQGGTTVYRVVKRAAEETPGVLYDLNANVESAGNGQNPVTSFDLKTGGEMSLNQETTKAGYVLVENSDASVATTVKVGKTEGSAKVDQTLVVNNGLDVQGNSKVDVQAGSTLVIGKGGIVTEDPKNIVIEADRAGAASLIMDPAITVNQTPNLTVRMTAKQIGKTLDGEFWHRFAMPVQHADSWDKEGSLGTGNDKYPTFLYGWNYSTDSWYKLPGGVSDMQAFMGYTLRLATEEIAATDELQDVVYIFKGQLAGNTNNTLQFSRNGYNFFGNSYTGYIDLKQLVAQITGDSKIEGTAWVWNTDLQRYQDVPLNLLAAGTYDNESDKWKTEIAPMQTFILKQNGSENASTEINYASAVWGNPRYSAATGVAAAPARRVANVNTTRMYIAVTAANGQSDEVFFVEDANYSDAFDNGYDASKYMNPNTINVFANQNGIDLGTVASDNLNGKTLSLNTNGELAYTMSFKNVEGEEYAIRDNVTGAVINIEEGATYEFAAQPNSTVEGRFEIVAIAKLPTAIENTEVKANVKGIYTIMGQYLGENFDILPAGVYVVNGVKIVK